MFRAGLQPFTVAPVEIPTELSAVAYFRVTNNPYLSKFRKITELRTIKIAENLADYVAADYLVRVQIKESLENEYAATN